MASNETTITVAIDKVMSRQGLDVRLAEALASLDVKLPLSADPGSIGPVIDAEGRDVLTVDSNGIRPNAQVAAIVDLIVVACNVMGGVRSASDSEREQA